MLDIKFIRENADLVQKSAKAKGYDVDIKKLLELDERRRKWVDEVESLRAKRNQLADAAKGGKPSDEQVAEGKKIKEELAELEKKLQPTETEYKQILKSVPNVTADDVPVGKSEVDNKVEKEWGEKTKFDFEPKNHWEIAEARGWIDKERAAKVAGSRFAYIMGDLVKLQFALLQFAFNVLTDEKKLAEIAQQAGLKDISTKPFIPTLPPAMARTEVYEATGRLNKEEITYKLEGDDLWLNASSEHTMAPMYMGEVLEAKDLPLRYVGYTTAFRREAGTYGKDMEGILRMHQFDKLEMESFTVPEDGLKEHLFMIAIQEYLMQQLGLPYHVLNKCTVEIGFPNARGVDIEVWLPGQDKYRETHTADFISDFQAEGTNTRIRTDDGIVYAHNNDATAFAMGRTLIAIIENCQDKDGKVHIPKVLRPYMQNTSVI